jgi:uncharacterized RDD family membrane protein YckC
MKAPPTLLLRSPDGIELRLATAAASDRLVALVIDLTLMLLLVLVTGVASKAMFGAGGFLLVFFLVRHGYFLWFETRGNGATPGKRRLHLRVVRTDGGPLTTDILLARNLTREIELFLPLILLANPDLLFAEHSGVIRLVASLWVLLLLFFPLTNPRRLRIGDLLAGTAVVFTPPASLAIDLAVTARQRAAEAEPEFRFVPAQLAIYGEHELTVLEDVLRKAERGGRDPAVLAVAKSIAAKIDWSGTPFADGAAERFLRAFYTAQRDHLEQRRLLGRRRASKQSPAARGS